jgi:glycosyltransferase involved in cell wall biosynthesis
MIKFSVIILSYNHSSFLKQRIDSVLLQHYKNFEIIIIDDCSNDTSREIIGAFSGHPQFAHIFYRDTNSGSPFNNWKDGIAVATGEWIWIAESDDFASPDFLGDAASAISNNPSDFGLFYCDSFIIDAENKIIDRRYSQIKNDIFESTKWSTPYINNGIEEINECLKYDCTVNNVSSMVFRKELGLKLSGDISSYSYYGDWFFCLSIAFLANICYTPKPLNYYRRHDKSYLNAPTSLLLSKFEYYKILKALYYNKNVSDKGKLLDHFTYNYLGFGLIEDGIQTVCKMLKLYLKTDGTLFLSVLLRLFYIKILRIKLWNAFKA